ncbi:MAG: hypothetical protein KatS3mg027_1485 [Bacteroidia bacterium]|nr:MAG: hypothetical protein KatS3mg027_1485 [Bacteroidia bacterium]
MRTLIFVTLYLVVSSHIFSQHNNSDSTEFYICYDYAYKLRNTNVDSAFFWINKALEISQLTANSEWRAKALNLKGILYYKKNDYYASIENLNRALSLTKDKTLKSKIYINLGNTLSDLNYSYSAIKYYEEAVRLFNELQDYRFLVRALMNLATEEFNIKQINSARNHLKLALYYAKENDLLEEEAMCLNNLSAIFIKTGQVDSASRYIYQSFNNYEQLENYYGLADAYLTAIELHLEKKELSYAKALMDLADSIIDKLRYLEGKKLLTSEKVNYYLLQKDVDNAQKYFNIYIRLEDSLNRAKNTSLSITENVSSQSNTTHKTNTNNTIISWVQLILISLCSSLIAILLIKNYRHEQE